MNQRRPKFGQGSFAFGPGARNTDPETSWDAAERDPEQRAKHRQLAREVHEACPDGLTDFELADITGLQQTSIGKRRGELRDLGLIEDSGLKRPAPSGSLAIVWRIKCLS